jgi:hypothetical protein
MKDALGGLSFICDFIFESYLQLVSAPVASLVR